MKEGNENQELDHQIEVAMIFHKFSQFKKLHMNTREEINFLLCESKNRDHKNYMYFWNIIVLWGKSQTDARWKNRKL